jgi:hypothetical protein
MRKSVINSAVAAMGLGLMLASAPAAAAVTWYNPITAFEDDNIDTFIDNDKNGSLSVGDRLVSIFKFNSTSGIFAGQGPSAIGPSHELTGVSDITITGAVLNGSTIAGLPSYDFTFGASAGGYITGGAGSVANIAGAMAVFWLDDSPNLTVINGACGTLASCLGAASDGLPNPWLAVGTQGDDDAYWVASGAANIAGLAGLPSTSKVADVNFNLNILENNTGQNFALQDCVPIGANCGDGDGKVLLIGSADILGGQGLVNGWGARSDTDFQLARVPEPGSLALLAMGLLAAGVASRKRPVK